MVKFPSTKRRWIATKLIHFWSERLLVMGSESLTTMSSENESRWALQTVVKPGLTVRKVLLCGFWDWQWQSSTTSCSPKAKRLIRQRPATHTSIGTRQNLREFGWNKLMHPPYCLDLALSDFFLPVSVYGDKICVKWRLWKSTAPVFPHRDEGFYESATKKLSIGSQQLFFCLEGRKFHHYETVIAKCMRGTLISWGKINRISERTPKKLNM